MITAIGGNHTTQREIAFLCIHFLHVRTLLEPHSPFIAARRRAAEPHPVPAGTCLNCAAVMQNLCRLDSLWEGGDFDASRTTRFLGGRNWNSS